MKHRGSARQGRRTPSRHTQKGLAAIEFAFIFPIVFTLVYGMITYGLILMAEQTLTMAVGEGSRVAVRYSGSSVGPAAPAIASVTSAASWLNTNATGFTAVARSAVCPYASGTGQCMQIAASYDYAANPLVPTIPFLNFLLPSTLSVSTIVQLP